MESNYLTHYGIKGQKWGIRRYQNPDGSLTSAGRKRYSDSGGIRGAVSKVKNAVTRRGSSSKAAAKKKQAEKEALDPDANYTEDKGDFEIPTEDEPEEPGEEDNEPI